MSDDGKMVESGHRVDVNLALVESDDGTPHVGVQLVCTDGSTLAVGLTPTQTREMIDGLRDLIRLLEAGRTVVAPRDLN